MSGDDDNVIHVSFETGRVERRGRKKPSDPPAASTGDARAEADERAAGLATTDVDPALLRTGRGDPIADLYSTAEVARLFGLTESRLRYWDRSGFLVPSGRVGHRRFYTFQDLIGLRAAKGLIDGGVPLHRVRQSVDALRGTLPRVTRPLSELRVVADGQMVVVRDEQGTFEATTGQQVLDFDVRTLRDDVVRVLRPRPGDRDRRTRAYERYLEGCRLDEDESTLDRAEAAYREAVTLDPSLGNALVNLGNVRYRRGAEDDAEALYRQALGVDPTQPEAHYNLGFLCFERGDAAGAARHFHEALQQDPSFADAHFNLAMAFEELGRSTDARVHWKSYLDLDPTGPWAEIARRHLAGAPPPRRR